MEYIKLISSFLTPIVVFVLGLLFLRKIEGIKQKISKDSEFNSKWASCFFDACNDFLKKGERYMALLSQLQSLENKNDEVGTNYQKELTKLNPEIQECELKIRRYVNFAPKNGGRVDKLAIEIQSYLSEMIRKGGNFDALFVKLKDFSNNAKLAHAEMLNLNYAKQDTPADTEKP